MDQMKALAPDEYADYFRVRLPVHNSVFEFIFEDVAGWTDFKDTMMRYLQNNNNNGPNGDGMCCTLRNGKRERVTNHHIK